MYQNDLWLRLIRTLILFFVQFQIFDTVSCNILHENIYFENRN